MEVGTRDVEKPAYPGEDWEQLNELADREAGFFNVEQSIQVLP